jgi:hypothetical protein
MRKYAEKMFSKTTGKEGSHEISNDNRTEVVNCAMSATFFLKYNVPSSQHS